MDDKLETLRSLLTDVDALASAAAAALDRLPHLPRAADIDVRLNYGRLQSHVAATALACRETLLTCIAMLEACEREQEAADAAADARD